MQVVIIQAVIEIVILAVYQLAAVLDKVVECRCDTILYTSWRTCKTLNIAETQLSIALNKLILKAVNTNIFVIIRPTDSIDISRLTEGVGNKRSA